MSCFTVLFGKKKVAVFLAIRIADNTVEWTKIS